jgi:hypothetical protein
MRNAARTDANQPTIIKALQAIGCKVYYSKLPLDLIVSGGKLGKQNLLVEVKMPGEGLTKAQKDFTESWPGAWVIVTTPEEAIEAVLGKDAIDGY